MINDDIPLWIVRLSKIFCACRRSLLNLESFQTTESLPHHRQENCNERLCEVNGFCHLSQISVREYLFQASVYSIWIISIFHQFVCEFHFFRPCITRWISKNKTYISLWTVLYILNLKLFKIFLFYLLYYSSKLHAYMHRNKDSNKCWKVTESCLVNLMIFRNRDRLSEAI